MQALLQHQRHNQIIERLRNGETLSITELAREWNTTTKTIQRDFRKLMEGSYGIIRAEGSKRFMIPQQNLNREDASTAIHLLESLAKDIGGDIHLKAHAALQKIQQYIDSPFYTRIDVENITDKLYLINDIEKAISSHTQLTLYYKPHGAKKVRIYKHVKPYKIVIFDGIWYLLVQYKGNTMKPRLKEIMRIEIENESFHPDKLLLDRMERAIDIWFDPKAEPFEVVLMLDTAIITYFENKPIKGQRLQKNPDGTATLTFDVTHKRELFGLVKKWLPQMHIVEPEVLQKELNRMLSAYLSFYK